MSLNPDTVVDTWIQLLAVPGDRMNPKKARDGGRPRRAPSVSYSITVRPDVHPVSAATTEG